MKLLILCRKILIKVKGLFKLTYIFIIDNIFIIQTVAQYDARVAGNSGKYRKINVTI